MNYATEKSTIWTPTELQLNRVYEIVLVASPYDAYILEEDGQLAEKILNEALGMKLMNTAPRIWQAPTAKRAMKIMNRRTIDLVILMLRISDADPLSLGRAIKQKYPGQAVILMIFDESELKHLPSEISSSEIDKVFIYEGNANVFPAIIKWVEDVSNAKRDIKRGNVRALILIEDKPKYYSVMLPEIYGTIIYHNRKIISHSFTEGQGRLRMRTRPKVLLASTFEQAKKFWDEYRENILGIISDIRFPKEGKLQRMAGVEFVEMVRETDDSVPIMFMSTETDMTDIAASLNATYVRKQAVNRLTKMRNFIVENFGFGSFIFRDSNYKYIGKARSIPDLLEKLRTVPVESLYYHGHQHHFSNWLSARGELAVATRLRRLSSDDAESPEEYRQMIIKEIMRSTELKLNYHDKPQISDGRPYFVQNFRREGNGSMGGKARGLAFINHMILHSEIQSEFPDLNIRVPRAVVLCTDFFENFMNENDLWQRAIDAKNNNEIRDMFLDANLNERTFNILSEFTQNVTMPFAVRSSSLLEDSQYQPLSGMYSTFMLPNCSEDEERMRQIVRAVKLVYASTFFEGPRSLLGSTEHRIEEERMAVILMELVAQRFDEKRFYPTFSGVAQSYNYYPVGHMEREDGVAFLALGFGRSIVEGERSLRLSPAHPRTIPQFYSNTSIMESSQRDFYILKKGSCDKNLLYLESENLELTDLDLAEKDGVLQHVGSTITKGDGRLRDSLHYEGTRIVSFAPVLKFDTYPLTRLLQKLLEIGQLNMGCPVEIEFAGNIFNDSDRLDEFCLLQIKPMTIGRHGKHEDMEAIPQDRIFCKSEMVLGDGYMDEIYDIVYVKMDSFDASKTSLIAGEIEAINQKLGRQKPYVLIGPGRWGTADPWLGIPVIWQQISNAKIIVETSTKDFNIDPSFGSHFFQNVTSLRLGYFTVNHRRDKDVLDMDWLEELECIEETETVKWVRVAHGMSVQINGRKGLGAVMKGIQLVDEMDENESMLI